MAHGNHVIQSAVPDVIGPAITTKDPDRFFDKVITSIKDFAQQVVGDTIFIDQLQLEKLLCLAAVLPGLIPIMHVLQPLTKHLFQLF